MNVVAVDLQSGLEPGVEDDRSGSIDLPTGVSIADSSRCTSQMDEDEDYPKSLQEELNEIIEAWYSLLTEEDIRQYQKYLEDITGQKVAEGAIQETGEVAPDFELPDQDGDVVHLDQLCQEGPVVLVFYRGAWCPHCNTAVRSMQKILNCVEQKGASIVCISPMLPDGTQFMATKFQLGFRVCSDVGNVVSKAFRISFPVHPDVRESFVKWGEDVPKANGDFTWEIPLPATYILGQGDRKIVWSLIDNDSGVRAEPAEILANLPCGTNAKRQGQDKDTTEETALIKAGQRHLVPAPTKGGAVARNKSVLPSSSLVQMTTNVVDKNNSGRGNAFRALKKKAKKLFGKKKQEPLDYLMSKFESETEEQQ